MPRPNSEVGSIRLQQHPWGLPCPPAEQKGQLTFGFPHWSHFAYLAGKKRGERCWLNETNTRQARVTGCHLYKSCCDRLVRMEDVASYMTGDGGHSRVSMASLGTNRKQMGFQVFQSPKVC